MRQPEPNPKSIAIAAVTMENAIAFYTSGSNLLSGNIEIKSGRLLYDPELKSLPTSILYNPGEITMSEFEQIGNELLSLIKEWEPKLLSLPDDIVAKRHNSQNRTIKQIVGHLVDSASNNTHRVVHLQNQESPLIFPDYANLGNNDKWIAIQNYQDENWNNLVQLWKYSTMHFAHVIRNIQTEKLANVWISALDEKVSLKAMIVDFPRHFKLHLDEINALIVG